MRKMVRWSVGAGSVPGGALGGVGGARSGVLLAGEGRVLSRGGTWAGAGIVLSV